MTSPSKYSPFKVVDDSSDPTPIVQAKTSLHQGRKRRRVVPKRLLMKPVAGTTTSIKGKTKRKKKNKRKRGNKARKIKYLANISIKFPKARKKTRKQGGGKKIKLTKLSPLENIILRRIRKTKKTKRS